MLLERRDRRLDDHVILLPAIRGPHNQADRSRLLAVDENLARLDDDRVGDPGVGDRDARDVEVRGDHRRPARGERHSFDSGQPLDRLIRGRRRGRGRRRLNLLRGARRSEHGRRETDPEH